MRSYRGKVSKRVFSLLLILAAALSLAPATMARQLAGQGAAHTDPRAKIHADLLSDIDAALSSGARLNAATASMQFVARIVPGTDLGPYAERWFARPFVDPLGLTVGAGSAQPSKLLKMAALPGVIFLQRPEFAGRATQAGRHRRRKATQQRDQAEAQHRPERPPPRPGAQRLVPHHRGDPRLDAGLVEGLHWRGRAPDVQRLGGRLLPPRPARDLGLRRRSGLALLRPARDVRLVHQLRRGLRLLHRQQPYRRWAGLLRRHLDRDHRADGRRLEHGPRRPEGRRLPAAWRRRRAHVYTAGHQPERRLPHRLPPR